MAEWRAVVGYEGHYEVSSAGQVRSLKGKPRVLRQMQGSGDYPRRQVSLCLDGVPHSMSVHKIVARAFLGAPTAPLIRHLDGNPRNNDISNLAYGTHSENVWDSVAHGAHANARKTECAKGHEFTAENTYPRPVGGRGCRKCGRESTRRYLARKAAK